MFIEFSHLLHGLIIADADGVVNTPGWVSVFGVSASRGLEKLGILCGGNNGHNRILLGVPTFLYIMTT